MADYKELSSRAARCLNCGDTLGYSGRSDKKFCCRRCKDDYNNKIRFNSRTARNHITCALERNYAFLNDLVKLGIERVSVEYAHSASFNFGYFTSSVHMPSYTQFMCYDIAYRVSETKIFNIQRLSLNLQIKKTK